MVSEKVEKLAEAIAWSRTTLKAKEYAEALVAAERVVLEYRSHGPNDDLERDVDALDVKLQAVMKP